MLRHGLFALTTIFALDTAAAAQTRVVVQGRVVERGDGSAVPNATVELDGHPIVATAMDGSFRFEQVEPGGYSLRSSALGYAPRDLFLVVRRDTTVLIEMDVAPFELDTLAVEGRTINVRGHVRDGESELSLFRAEIVTNLNRGTNTNSAGRFRLRDIPAGLPLAIGIRSFGYLPFDSVIVAYADTTLVFNLAADPLAQRMIAVEVGRLEKRSRPFRSAIMPPMDRERLVREGNGTVLDVLQSEYSIHLGRVRCILIDERQSYNGLEELALILPEELERIEVLERGLMLRIYTRDFIRKMLGGGIELVRPVYVPYGRPPFCR